MLLLKSSLKGKRKLDNFDCRPGSNHCVHWLTITMAQQYATVDQSEKDGGRFFPPFVFTRGAPDVCLAPSTSTGSRLSCEASSASDAQSNRLQLSPQS